MLKKQNARSRSRLHPRISFIVDKQKIKNAHKDVFIFGAGNEIRTRDIHLGKVTLYH